MRPLTSADPTSVAGYRLLGVLGGGGMGRVYLGQSPAGRRLAIKVIRADLAQDPVFRRRFAREVAAVRSVNPLFTAAVVDADPEAEAPWLATTYIDGPSLTSWVRQRGPMRASAVLTLGAGLAEALAAIHHVGLVHRDLKPSNVLLDDDGPHIIDFGIALDLDATRLTTSTGVGTPAYMAPECLDGGDIGPAGDIFSLGATLFFAATGKSLVDDGTIYAQITQITRGRFDLSALPRELRPLILGCISRRAKDRPTAEELTRILVAAGVAAPEPGWQRNDSPPTAPVQPLVPVMPRRRLLVLGGVVGIAALAAVGAAVGTGTDKLQGGGSSSRGPIGPGGVRWIARSGARPLSSLQASDEPFARILVDGDSRIIAINGADVYANDRAGHRRWLRTFPAVVPGLRQWGDAVLVYDRRRLWLLDAAKGTQRIALDLDNVEQAGWRGAAPESRPVEVHRVALGADLMFVNLGTATVAIGRDGRQFWRNPLPDRPDGRPATSGDPVVADPTRLLTVDVFDAQAQVGLFDTGTGTPRWVTWQDVPPPPPAPPGPGGPGGPGGPRGGGPDGRGGGDPSWNRTEGRIASSAVAWRRGQEIQVLRLADGQRLWRYGNPTPVTAIEVLGSLLLVAADRVTAYALDSGAPKWQAPLRGARIAALPDGKSLIAVTEERMSALDQTGDVLWDLPLPDEVSGAMPDAVSVAGDTSYLTFRPRDDRSQPLRADVVAVAV